MLSIRLVEEEIANRYSYQRMRCPTHLCIGQEAIAVGVCKNLKMKDRVYSNHRAHGHYIAKGGNLKAMIAELYGMKEGCSGGRGGSMHLIDLDVSFMGATPIVGGTVPLAVGSAWGDRLKGKNNVSVVFFGDGCFEEGVLHESMNFAALHKLPVIFVCENNDFSVFTFISDRQPKRPIHKIAKAHSLLTYSGNGNDIIEVYSSFKSIYQRVINGEGPGFLEYKTYRVREHCGPNYDNELSYRKKADILSGEKNCPIAAYEKILSERFDDFKDMRHEIKQSLLKTIDDSFNYADSLAPPNSDRIHERLFI